MKSTNFFASIVAVAALAIASVPAHAGPVEVSVLGGVQTLNENDTALPDQMSNVPAIASVAYHFSPNLAAEGEFSWLIPVKQNVALASGVTQELKTPDVLAYQANLRLSWPLLSWTPYVAGGAGAVTFLSNTDADRMPQLTESQTAFAINFGAGATFRLAEHWAVRADVRELAAFPSNDAQGLSSSGSSDAIWMERGALGLAYRF
jgi:opacity protein-like surface antigen